MVCELYTEYFCMQCQRLVEDPCTHFEIYPLHALKTLTTASGLYDLSLYNYGFSEELVAPISGTSTVVISGYPTIEEAINYLVASGVPLGMPTQVISGFPTIESAINHIVISGFPEGTPSTVLSGYDTLEDAIEDICDSKVSISGDVMTGHLTLNADPTADLHAATKQYVDSQSGGGSGSTDIELCFGGEKDKYGLTTSNSSYEVHTAFRFGGTSTLGTPTAIKAVVSLDGGDSTGYVKIYDRSNNKTIVSKSFTNDDIHILNLGSLSNLPSNEAVWEVQIKANNATIICSSLSILF